MQKFALAAALTLLAAPAFAQSELERLEVASVAAGQNLEAFMTSVAPELGTAMPDWTWDIEMRTAGSCTLDMIRAEGGADAVISYLTSLETFSTMELTSMQQMATDTPVPVNTTFAERAGRECGSAEIALRRMQESGFMDAMMNPEIMGRFIEQ